MRPNSAKPELLTHNEACSLIRNLAETCGETGFTEDEGCLVIDWAKEAKLTAALLELVLSGKIGILVKDGEIMYRGRGANSGLNLNGALN